MKLNSNFHPLLNGFRYRCETFCLFLYNHFRYDFFTFFGAPLADFWLLQSIPYGKGRIRPLLGHFGKVIARRNFIGLIHLKFNFWRLTPFIFKRGHFLDHFWSVFGRNFLWVGFDPPRTLTLFGSRNVFENVLKLTKSGLMVQKRVYID